MEMKQFRQSLGFFGESYLGERLFYVVKSPNEDSISLKDYLIYYDGLYHGNADTKLMNTYKMLDIEGKGEVKLKQFIEFWKQFIKMYAIACSIKIKFTQEMERTFEQEFILAAKSKDGVMRFEDFKRAKAEHPDYL